MHLGWCCYLGCFGVACVCCCFCFAVALLFQALHMFCGGWRGYIYIYIYITICVRILCAVNKLCPVNTCCRNKLNTYIYIYTWISPCGACLHLLSIAGGGVGCRVGWGVLGWWCGVDQVLGSIGGRGSSGVAEQDCIE